MSPLRSPAAFEPFDRFSRAFLYGASAAASVVLLLLFAALVVVGVTELYVGALLACAPPTARGARDARLDQVERLLSPEPIRMDVNGESILFRPDDDLYSAVAPADPTTADRKKIALLAASAAATAQETARGACGTVFVGRRADLAPAASLRRMAAAGGMPAVFCAYAHGEHVILIDGSVVVRLKPGTARGVLEAACRPMGLAVVESRKPGGTPGALHVVVPVGPAVGGVTPAGESTGGDPFAVARTLAAVAGVVSAEPSLLLLVRPAAGDAPKAKAKGESKAESKGGPDGK